MFLWFRSNSVSQGNCGFLAYAVFFASIFTAPIALAQEVGDLVRVDTLRLNLRSGPGTENPVIREMPEGTGLRIIARQEGWAKVKLEDDTGTTGWTSARFLTRNEETPAVDAESFYSQLEAQHGVPDGRGYLEAVDIHFAYYCRSRSGLGIALFRPDAHQPLVWERDEWCVDNVSEKDIDLDGKFEILYHTKGGGSGTFAVQEKILHWPKGNAAPDRGFEYTALQVDQIGTPFDLALILKTMREMRHGESCRVRDYCPEWPPKATCRPVIGCAMTEIKEIDIAAPTFPKRLRNDPEWKAYIKNYLDRGFVLISDDNEVERLEDLQLGDLGEKDDGTRPEMSSERKAQIDVWLD